MLFNSLQFLLFYPIVLAIYFVTPKKFKWFVLLLASYYFYMSWKPEYLILIIITTVISFLSAILIEKSKSKSIRKLLLIGSISICLGILFFFKYFNFLSSNIYALLELLGLKHKILSINYLLPVGISFYTFQTLSYSIDVYKSNKKAERHFGIYALYVSFFPQLVAGPIERSTKLLPQFKQVPQITPYKIITGVQYIVFGFFMKLVVADRASIYVDSIYNNVGNHEGLSLLTATFLFSFQIYGDFAGYSSIAIGVARIMGYDLMTNFNRPYFAKSISDFWSRWHISLSTWFRDYVYIPLGGNRVSKFRWMINILLTFTISGLWHGAAWTFIFWGIIHGVIIILEKLIISPPQDSKNIFLRRAFVFSISTLAWIFFRANSIQDAFHIYKQIFTNPGNLFTNYEVFFYALLGISILTIHDIHDELSLKTKASSESFTLSSAIYYSFLVIIILNVGVFNGGQFIYFQF